MQEISSKTIAKTKRFETQIKTFETTIANVLLQKSKRNRTKSVSTRRSLRGNSCGNSYKKYSKTRKPSTIKQRLAKELKRSSKPVHKKSGHKRSIPRNPRNEVAKTTYSHDDYIVSESADEDDKSPQPLVKFLDNQVTPEP